MLFPDSHIGRSAFLNMTVVSVQSKLTVIRPITTNRAEQLYVGQKGAQG